MLVSVAKKYMMRTCAMLICSMLLAVVWSGKKPVCAEALPGEGDELRRGSISLTYELEDTAFSLYQAVKGDGAGGWMVSESFQGYPLDMDGLIAAGHWRTEAAQTGSSQAGADQIRPLTEALAAYVNRDGLTPLRTGRTGDGGRLSFDGLEPGVYLILGEIKTQDGYRYIPSPVLVHEPGADGSLIDGVELQIKYEREEEPEGDRRVSLSAYKVWRDGEGAGRPASVDIQLLRDGALYGTYTLNEANNWRWEWTNLPAGYLYQIAEKSVPAGYTVGVERSGDIFVVTNTLSEAPPSRDVPSQDPPPATPGEVLGAILKKGGEVLSGRIPQTGQVWWPAAALAAAGLGCLILGIRKRKRRDKGT